MSRLSNHIVERSAPLPERRVVLLGASNLRRCMAIVWETVRGVWGTPLDVLAAFGHGRSYGVESRVLGRSLPGIVECDLWKTLPSRPPAVSAALITDVGNDLLYGRNVTIIVKWVRICLERLAATEAKIIVTELPISTLDGLGPIRYQLMRSLLFPSCRLSLATILGRARELNFQLVELARQFSAVTVKPQAEWYGWDPIHIRYRAQNQAWGQIFSNWSHGSIQPSGFRASLRMRWYLQSLKPSRRRMWGIEQLQAQPCSRLSDGTLISLY